MLAALLLQLALPQGLVPGPAIVVVGIECVLLVTLVAVNPSRIDHRSRDLRLVSKAMVVLLSATNAAGLGMLLRELVAANPTLDGRALIRAGVNIWFTGVLAFGLWYWEIDRGGPIRRCTPGHGRPDFLFTQMTNQGVTDTPWSPRFLDYLYVSLTNQTAFSATDTMPLTPRAKALMAAQSVMSLATVVVVGARAVNILR